MGIGVIIGWTAIWSQLIYNVLQLNNILRVSSELEILGLDEAFHGGLAYNFGNYEYDDEVDNVDNVDNNSKLEQQ